MNIGFSLVKDSLCRYQMGCTGVMEAIIPIQKQVDHDAASCCMSKSVFTDKDADMVDSAAITAEKNKVAGLQVLFRHHSAEQCLFSGSTRQEHPEVLFVEILHKSRAVEAFRGCSAWPVMGAEVVIN